MCNVLTVQHCSVVCCKWFVVGYTVFRSDITHNRTEPETKTVHTETTGLFTSPLLHWVLLVTSNLTLEFLLLKLRVKLHHIIIMYSCSSYIKYTFSLSLCPLLKRSVSNHVDIYLTEECIICDKIYISLYLCCTAPRFH